MGGCGTRVRHGIFTALVVGSVVLGSTVAPSAAGAAPGACGADTPAGVSVVVDFGSLGAETLVRCSPTAGTGAATLRTAGVAVTGVTRWGMDAAGDPSFVCRLEGRPRADESLTLPDGRTYTESCADTPPTTATWTYWHAAPGDTSWRFSQLGPSARDATAGGAEGWSFQLGSGPAAPPRGAPPVAAALPTPTPPAQGPASTQPAPAPPAGGGASGTTKPVRTVALPVASAAARSAASWLVADLGADHALPGPDGRPDWGLTMDALLALHAAGTGSVTARQVRGTLARHVDAVLGPDLLGTPDARIAGTTAKLLVTIVVGSGRPVVREERALRVGRYQIRHEVLGLLSPSGHITSRGSSGADGNVFAQSLAVIGLARSGGVPASAVRFLRVQQCTVGGFPLEPSAAGGSCTNRADLDATTMAIQALVTARDIGSVRGLDAAVARATRWLLAQQGRDGSFGGAGGGSPNANSTGLAAQALAAAAGTAGVDAARVRRAAAAAQRWTVRQQVDVRRHRGTPLISGGDAGAIAWDAAALVRGRREGVADAARDQWRRATTQALFALAPRPLSTLGTTRLHGEPPKRPSTAPSPATPSDTRDAAQAPPLTYAPNADGQEQGAVGGTTPDTSSPALEPAEPATQPLTTPSSTDAAADPGTAASPSAAPASRLASWLAGAATGDHLEVTRAGTTFVDYDATTDLVLALHALDEQPDLRARASRFLLTRQTVDDHALGAHDETHGGAAYVEPIARLLVAGTLYLDTASGTPSEQAVVTELRDRLLQLQDTDGELRDTGDLADPSHGVRAQAWGVLALRATGQARAADHALGRLIDAQCSDGTFSRTFAAGSCGHGDLETTATAVLALQAVRSDDAAAVVPGASADADADPSADWSRAHVAALFRATAALDDAATSDESLVRPRSAEDLELVGTVASARHASGRDLQATTDQLVAFQRPDGSIAAPGAPEADVAASLAAAVPVAGRSWLDGLQSPLAAGLAVPADLEAAPIATHSGGGRWRTQLVAAVLGLVPGTLIALELRRRSQRRMQAESS